VADRSGNPSKGFESEGKMDRTYDLVIRGGTVIDGTASIGRQADVAIKEGVIAAVGGLMGRGARKSMPRS